MGIVLWMGMEFLVERFFLWAGLSFRRNSFFEAIKRFRAPPLFAGDTPESGTAMPKGESCEGKREGHGLA
jgi:hypothetical protein